MKLSYYFIDSDGVTHGPVSIDHFKQEKINCHSWVWHKGLPHWVEVHTIPSLKCSIDNTLPISFSNSLNIINCEEEKYKLPVPLSDGEATNLEPKRWLVESIIITLLCCLPLGILAIIQSARVETLWRNGHYGEAIAASRRAEFWIKLAIIITIALWIIYIVLWMFTPLAEKSLIWYNDIWE